MPLAIIPFFSGRFRARVLAHAGKVSPAFAAAAAFLADSLKPISPDELITALLPINFISTACRSR